jgi:hypothetical protein
MIAASVSTSTGLLNFWNLFSNFRNAISNAPLLMFKTTLNVNTILLLI